MESLRDAEDPRGKDIVNASDLAYSKLPESVRPGAEVFKAKIESTPKLNAGLGKFIGATRKAVYRIGGERTDEGKVKPSRLFIVKPFYENLAPWSSNAYYPTSGFAEMTHQSLMHAAGIGDSASKVHTFIHKDHPYLVVEADPDVTELGRISNIYGTEFTPDRHWMMRCHAGDEVKDDLAKLGIIDYLSNDQDRHENNLMAEHGAADGATPMMTRILSIDNGRSYQYRKSSRYHAARDSHLFAHWRSPGIDLATRGSPFITPERMQRVLDWWRNVHPDISEAFDTQAKAVSDELVRNWMVLNFRERLGKMQSLVDYWSGSAQDDNTIAALDFGKNGGAPGKDFKLLCHAPHENRHGNEFIGAYQ